MKRLRIFKFRDTLEFDTAYVIASNDYHANRIMKNHTDLKVEIIDCRSLEDFPKAMIHFEHHGESVWINDIKPF